MADPYSVEKRGNQLFINMDDGTVALAAPTGYGYWLVSASPGTPPPIPSNDFKFPFERSLHTTYPGHSGADWPASSVGGSAAIRSIGPGVVHRAYHYNGNTSDWGDAGAAEPVWRGNCVVVNHGTIDGIEIWSLYAHMSSINVNEDQQVTGGQQLGVIGDTGYSFGAHLHFEVIYNGVRLSTGQGGYERTIGWMDAHASGSW